MDEHNLDDVDEIIAILLSNDARRAVNNWKRKGYVYCILITYQTNTYLNMMTDAILIVD